jgi:hypothetical protein
MLWVLKAGNTTSTGNDMTSEQFTYWLQGFTELNSGKRPNAVQWAMIQDHLAEVFVKVTPNHQYGGGITTLPRPITSISNRTAEFRQGDLPVITC